MNDEDRCMYCRMPREDHTASHPFAPLPAAPTQSQAMEYLRGDVIEKAGVVADYYMFERASKQMRMAAMFALARAVKALDEAEELAHIAEKQS